jgi:ribosomal protein L7/L12
MDEALRQQIIAVLHSEGKVPALTALRDKTGMGLGEAEAFTDGLPLSASAAMQPRTASAVDEKLQGELRVMLRRDGRLVATKTLRDQTGMSLHDAQAFLDKLRASSSPFLPTELLDHAANFVLNAPPTDERARADQESVNRWGEAQWETAI